MTHLRREPAPPPGLRAAAPLGPGEALDRLVVRSDGDGRVLDASCERELLPAPACPALARRHGSAGASADPIVAGAALHGLPGGPLTVELPARIALDARDGDGKLRLALPPGGRAELELSSTIDESRLAELDLGLAPPAAVVAGEVPALCARRSLTLVHAVRRPLADPVLEAVDVRAQAGRALVQLRGVVRCDRPTTGRIDLEASWTERADTGSGPLVEQERRRTIGAVAVEADAVALALTQHAGDLRHRRVRYRPVAATRFPEFFAEPGVRAGAEVEVSIPNRAVPPRPDVHSLEPIFRGLPGLRVHLNRGWLASGEGELLGVDVEATRCLPAERFGNAVRTDGPPGRRLAGHAVRFDARLGLWYADVLFDAGGAPWPLAELALVRWQPDSVAGCELSPLVYVDALELL